MNEVTVKKALLRGQLMVNLPVMLIMFIGFGLTIYFSEQSGQWWMYPIGFVLSIALMWLWWSFMITYWRIWAFSRVRNVHRLKEKAIEEKLIWPDGSIYEKTEIRTKKQSAVLQQLTSKFNLEDVPEVVIDNRGVPYETKVYFSKWARFFPIVLAFIVFGYGVFKIADGESYGYFLLLVAVVLYFLDGKKERDPNPQIILNEKGIQTVHIKFMSWTNIKNIQLKSDGRGRRAKLYLVIDFKEKDQRGYWGERINVSEFYPTDKKLMRIIKIYQQRHHQKFGSK